MCEVGSDFKIKWLHNIRTRMQTGLRKNQKGIHTKGDYRDTYQLKRIVKNKKLNIKK